VNCVGWTDVFAFSAADAFRRVRIFGWIDIHRTAFGAGAAVYTAGLIDTVTEQGYFVKERIDCPERADEFTEWPVYDDRGHDDNNQYDIFPEIKKSYCSSQRFIKQNKRQAAFECACRTD